MNLKTGIRTRIGLSVLLSGICLGGFRLFDRFLPRGAAALGIADVLAMPGFWLARIFYPDGVHTGGNAPYRWVVVLIGSLVIFYSLVWFLILSLLNRSRIAAQANERLG
jgi:hypothetical protein